MIQQVDSVNGGAAQAWSLDDVYSSLIEQIVEGRLAPGVELDLAGLAATYGVDAESVSDALSRLGSANLVDLVPDVGAFVSQVDPKTLLDSIKVIGFLCSHAAVEVSAPPTVSLEEGLQAILADMQATEAGADFIGADGRQYDVALFDLLVVEAGNPVVAETIDAIFPSVRRAAIVHGHLMEFQTLRDRLVELVEVLLTGTAQQVAAGVDQYFELVSYVVGEGITPTERAREG